MKGIFFDEDKPVSFAEADDEEDFFDSRALPEDRPGVGQDHARDEGRLRRPQKHGAAAQKYEGNHYPDYDPDHLPKDVLIRVVINDVLLAICGWSLPTCWPTSSLPNKPVGRTASQRTTPPDETAIRTRGSRSSAGRG